MSTKINLPSTKAEEIVITRVFNAPRALVFEAWTNPVHLARWWGPRGFDNPRCELDVRPGGLIRIDMRAPNGTLYPMSGIYLEIIQPEKITYTAGALDEKGAPIFEMLFTVTFAEKNGKTTLTITSRLMRATGDAAKYLGGYEAGMTQSLEKLSAVLAQPVEPLVLERTFNAPIGFVWRALTNKEDFRHWYFDVSDFRAEAGFEFQFTGDCKDRKYVHHCRVIEVIPGKKLACTWRYDGYEGNSLVTFELFQEGNKTRLKLTHEGLETFPKTPHFAHNNFVQGWTAIIGTNLKQYVEKQDNENPLRPL